MFDSNINTVCPYFTMFPLDFPLKLLKNGRVRKGWVYDPFCGRGTTNLAARLRNLPSVGVDSSPVAAAIAEAKVCFVTATEVFECAKAIFESAPDPIYVPDEPFWKYAYEQSTFFQVCRFREDLLRDCSTSPRKVLRAVILGALHGPRTKGEPSYFSNQCLRTFAPKPTYAVQFWKHNGMNPPVVDILGLIGRKVKRYLSTPFPRVEGKIILGDSRTWKDEAFTEAFSWVITSPPYYGMNTYIQDQWIRNWFVGGLSTVDYNNHDRNICHSSPEIFISQLKKVWINAATMSLPNAKLVCRFGGIHNRRQDCIEIVKSSFEKSGWQITQIRKAGWALDGNRQAAQFGKSQAIQPRKEYDVYARRAS